MSKFSIQIEGGSLDLYKQDISWEWTNIRFADGIKDQYSTDVEIPKTMNNMNLLGISGLLDSSSQLFGTHIQPCILGINGTMMDVYLQVVGITEDSITICLYERTLPEEIRGKDVSRLVVDTNNTIVAWNINTLNAYPSFFYKYGYGMPYDNKYAQYHPVMKANRIIDNINNVCGVNVQHVSEDWYVMATRKNVCPQNWRQTMEGVYSGGKFHIMGGQHITNDLAFSYNNTDNNKITFNRHCVVNINLWVSWHAKSNGYSIPFVVNHWKAATGTNDTHQLNMRGDLYTNYVDQTQLSFTVEEYDHISFNVIDGSHMNMVRCVADMTITDYNINDDDYGVNMDYVGRLPRLIVYNYAANSYDPLYFDATTYYTSYHERHTSTTKHQKIESPWTSFAWFGYYTNLPEMKVSDFLWGLCWLRGEKIIIEQSALLFVPTNETCVLENAVITEISPQSDKLGMHNYLKFDGQENVQSLMDIDNEWLATDVTLHQSPFGFIREDNQFIGTAKQYSNPEYDEETEGYSCDFEEVGFLVWENITHVGNMQVTSEYIKNIQIQTMGLEKLTQSMECTIETRDNTLTDVDYVYLDGRKFMVVDGNTDLNTNETTLTCLLVPPQNV